MWSGFDPELRRDFDSIRELVALRHQAPTREWPLVFVDEFDALLVVREWPDGSMTTYATSEYSDAIRENGGGLAT
jgi:hypothetical protein